MKPIGDLKEANGEDAERENRVEQKNSTRWAVVLALHAEDRIEHQKRN